MKKIYLFITLLILSGCLNRYTIINEDLFKNSLQQFKQVNKSIRDQLSVGMSESQVKNLLGTPQEVSLAGDGNLILEYCFYEMNLKGARYNPALDIYLDESRHHKKLLVLFDEDMKVKNLHVSERQRSFGIFSSLNSCAD